MEKASIHSFAAGPGHDVEWADPSNPSAESGRTERSGCGLAAVAVGILAVLLLSSCLSVRQGKNFAIGTESNRANAVVFARASKDLTTIARLKGVRAARNTILALTPNKVRITPKQRLVMCAASPALCLSADLIGRTLISWFKSDIRHRGDFWEALNHAGRTGRCFAWTFAPSRNLTHKGIGTSGCRWGK